jgi:hypothetical protein
MKRCGARSKGSELQQRQSLLDYLPAIKVAGKVQIPLQKESRRISGAWKYSLCGLSQYRWLNRVCAGGAIYVTTVRNPLDRGAFVDCFTFTMCMPFPGKPFALFKHFRQVMKNIIKSDRWVRPEPAGHAVWHVDMFSA